MKLNPCKWCGKEPGMVVGKYICISCREGWQESRVDFDTWQKNNPLPEKKAALRKAAEDMVEEYQANPELNFDLPPHQFKVGDWVKVDGKKYKVNEVGALDRQGEIHLVPFSGTYWIDAERLIPATRLKRKEIRERLENIKADAKQVCVFRSGAAGQEFFSNIDELIEEI